MLQKIFGNTSKAKLFKVFSATAIFTFAILVLFLWVFQIKEVFLVDYTGKSAPLRGAQKLKGDFLYKSDSYFKKTFDKAEVTLEAQEIRRLYPGVIQIVVKNIPPVVYLENNGSYVIFSERAKVLERQDEIPKALGEIKIPTTYVAKPLRAGESIDFREVIFATRVAKIIKNNAISAFRIEIVDSNLIICTLPTTNTTIKFSSNLNMEQSLERLNDFLEKLYTSGKTIRTLDLRFEKAIIEEN